MRDDLFEVGFGSILEVELYCEFFNPERVAL
jgi:hypothetical protein